jgi:hypothetical protein
MVYRIILSILAGVMAGKNKKFFLCRGLVSRIIYKAGICRDNRRLSARTAARIAWDPTA